MDRIARVSQNIKDGAKVFQNSSGTANRAAAFTYGGSLLLSMLDPSMTTTGALVLSGLGANGLARVMTNPKVVNWLARSTAVPVGSATAQIQILRRIGEQDKDEDVLALADALEQARAYEDSSQSQSAQQ
jgi:hypothetical protein